MPQTRMRELLSGLPGMSGARVARVLADGPTNASYLLERDGERFVLRIDKPGVAALGLDRDNERTVCAAVARAGLTPAYLWFDVAAGVCLRHWVPGRSLDRAALQETATLQLLAGTLRALHRLPPTGREFRPVAAARRYAAQLGTAEAGALAERAARILDDLERRPGAAALCHNDLIAANVLQTPQGGIRLIDWEYAAIGDPFFDLAVLVRHHELPDHLAEHLLSAYLEGKASAEARQRLALQGDFYRCLLDLWQLRVGGPGPA